MSYGGRWRPSKSQARDFAQTMEDIERFCADNGISTSRKRDSYYFTINGVRYRVSNHTVDASNAAAYDEFGQQIRPLYHAPGADLDVVDIFAGKTRIKQIYEDLKSGYKLDKRGRRLS